MKNNGSLNLSNPYKESLEGTIRTISEELSFSEKVHKNDSKEPAWKCRYVVTFFGFLIALSMGIHRTVVSVTIVAMVNNSAISQETTAKSESCPELIINSTAEEILFERKTEGEFLWSPKIQGYILGSYFLGYIITQVPAGRLSERYGCKWFLFGATLATAVFSMLIPPLSRLSAFAVIIIQTLRGFAQGLLGPCISVLVSNWYPKTERGFSYSIIHSAHPLGPVLGNIFAGYVSESPAGWPFVFYSIGILGIAFAVCISFFLAESPKEHPRISTAELDFILTHQETNLSRKRPKLPWRELLTSVPVYALSFAMFGRYWAVSQFWIVHSTFLGTILHYSIGQNGLLSAVPFLLSFLLSLIAAWISLYVEKKSIASANFLRKFWVFISSLGFSVFLFGSFVAGCNRNLSVIFAILSVGCSGLGIPGCLIVSADMSPTFAGTIQSICTVVGFFSSVLIPIVVGYLTDGNQTLEQWNKVFFLSIGIVMSSAVIFVLFGSAKIQPWNFVGHKPKDTIERHNTNTKGEEQTLEQWNKVFFLSIGIVMSSAVIFVLFGSAKIQPWNFVEHKPKDTIERHNTNTKGEEVTNF